MIRILPTGIIDPGNHLRDVVKHHGDLGCHDIGIVIIGNGRKDGGLIDAGPHENVIIDARSDDGLAAKVRTEAAKGIGIPVDDAHIVPFLIKNTRQPCPYASTSQNDSNHIPCPRLPWPTLCRSTATVPERVPALYAAPCPTAARGRDGDPFSYPLSGGRGRARQGMERSSGRSGQPRRARSRRDAAAGGYP